MENTDITISSLKLIYDGEALKNHEMDAMELALIIESLNDLFLEVNSELNSDFTTIKLKVKANFEKGSFGIEFIVELLKNMEDLLNSSPVTTTLTAMELLNILRNAINFIRMTKGKISENNNSSIEIATVDYYKAPDIIVDRKNKIYRKEVVLRINKLSFEETNKWTLYNVDIPKISVLIEDKKFLNNVKYNKEHFSKDDELRVILRIEEFYKHDKQIIEYFVEEVLEHKKAIETPYMPFVD